VLVSKATLSDDCKVAELTGPCHRDASTPTHDFLISPHPQCDKLYIATGGSFHGWKFLPVIGDYVVDMMQGSLDSDLADRWAWDKKGGDGHSANPTYQIVGDLQDWTRGWAN
jgi:sarcosine oxidase/L-pipecolate oxidase